MLKIYNTDPWLEPFKEAVDLREKRISEVRDALCGKVRLSEKVNNHLFYGLHLALLCDLDIGQISHL